MITNGEKLESKVGDWLLKSFNQLDYDYYFFTFASSFKGRITKKIALLSISEFNKPFRVQLAPTTHGHRVGVPLRERNPHLQTFPDRKEEVSEGGPCCNHVGFICLLSHCSPSRLRLSQLERCGFYTFICSRSFFSSAQLHGLLVLKGIDRSHLAFLLNYLHNKVVGTDCSCIFQFF